MDLANLKDQIKSLYETDMGDFKRKVVTYLNNFLEENKETSFQMKIKDIKNRVICYITPEKNPIEEIDLLRREILDTLENL
ncbi:MAG: hypothetical protein ACR2M7_05775 [Bdellovibrionales bacterium]